MEFFNQAKNISVKDVLLEGVQETLITKIKPKSIID